jgi:hypothetical protein
MQAEDACSLDQLRYGIALGGACRCTELGVNNKPWRCSISAWTMTTSFASVPSPFAAIETRGPSCFRAWRCYAARLGSPSTGHSAPCDRVGRRFTYSSHEALQTHCGLDQVPSTVEDDVLVPGRVRVLADRVDHRPELGPEAEGRPPVAKDFLPCRDVAMPPRIDGPGVLPPSARGVGRRAASGSLGCSARSDSTT